MRPIRHRIIYLGNSVLLLVGCCDKRGSNADDSTTQCITRLPRLVVSAVFPPCIPVILLPNAGGTRTETFYTQNVLYVFHCQTSNTVPHGMNARVVLSAPSDSEPLKASRAASFHEYGREV